MVDQRKISVRSAGRICGGAHVPGKSFPTVDLNPAFLPSVAARSGVDRFHQRPWTDVAWITDDRRSPNFPISGWKRWRIEWGGRNAPLRRGRKGGGDVATVRL